jgi:hypothetical protein
VANLNQIVTKIPGAGVNRTQGVMVTSNGVLAVNVWGNVLPARYADPLVVAVGDTVVVDLMHGPTGQSEAVVSGRLTTAPRPGYGTVKTVPPSSSTITVTGTDGTDYTALFASSYTPTVNDYVILAWNAATPTVTSKVGSTPAPTDAAAPVNAPPPPPQSGSTVYAATDSGTWTPSFGAWDAWAGGGGNVYQGGSAYGAANYGAWFYAGSPGQLSARTITRVRFTLGSRRTAGSYNAPVTVHLYAHTSANKPSGDVNRTAGPFDVTVQAGAGQVTVDLPKSWGSILTAGGGISIAGENYAGFNGRNTEPASGRLILDWTR